MKENKYDNDVFFKKYSQMDRSKKGLEAAGEWKTLERMLPDFTGKRVLDLGCGYGWHCQYAVEHGAIAVTGVDISEKMLAVAREHHSASSITYQCLPIEDVNYPDHSFDIVLSSLTFHYLLSFEEIVKKVDQCLAPGGIFVFSTEHPVFTAQGSQDWYYGEDGKPMHFPVDSYFTEGRRVADFLGEAVVKYHKTLTTYLNTLIKGGFQITGIEEPQPSKEMVRDIPGMADELRRPMMLIVSAEKRQL